MIWDLVALNSTPSIALHKEAEVAVGTMGIVLDYGGFDSGRSRWRISPKFSVHSRVSR